MEGISEERHAIRSRELCLESRKVTWCNWTLGSYRQVAEDLILLSRKCWRKVCERGGP